MANLHLIAGFVKVPLKKPYVVLLAIKIAFCWKMGNTVIISIVGYLPLLSFAKFMDNFDKHKLSIRGIIFFTNFTKNPSSCIIFTVNKLIYLQLPVHKIEFFSWIMLGDEVLKICMHFIGINDICISQLKLMKSYFVLGSAVIFYDIVMVNFHQQISHILSYSCNFLKFFFVLFLYRC